MNDVNEVWQANDDRVPMLTRCRYDIVQHRDADDVNDVNEVWQGTDVDTMSIRYRSTSRCRRCKRCKRGMTGYRCWHDVDTISSTSRCRRCQRCKRGMTGYWCLHDVDTISSTSRCQRCERCKRSMTDIDDRVPMLTRCRCDIVNIAMSTM